MRCTISKQTVINAIFVTLKKSGMQQTKSTDCAKCFKDKFGENEYYRMMQGFDLICCPDCFEKYYKKGGETK